MLKITNLTAILEDFKLLDDINLEVNQGELHVIIGPEKTGKTNLVHTLLGIPGITIKDGDIEYNNESLLTATVEDRFKKGIFVSFQHLPTIDGITNFELIKEILKENKDKRTSNEIEKQYKDLCKKLGLSSNHGHKPVNHPILSETECKKNELLQMFLFNPQLIILDEIEAEIEKDELELFAHSINEFLTDKTKAAIIITRSRELLDLMHPTHVHVLVNGEIRENGSAELYKRILENGYSQFSQS